MACAPLADDHTTRRQYSTRLSLLKSWLPNASLVWGGSFADSLTGKPSSEPISKNLERNVPSCKVRRKFRNATLRRMHERILLGSASSRRTSFM